MKSMKKAGVTDVNNQIIIRRRLRNTNPRLKVSSFFTIVVIICLETVLLSTVTHCAKTFYMHWNTTNSIFRIDNTDHIIDVNKGNSQFEYDQVHIICPVYEPGTFDNETEKYIIYNVSKVEYETCRITNHDPRIIAICDKPQKLMFFTITFRPFTPQPGGLEFLPGNDYYFISTSSKDDLHRRIGGRCSTNNMKVVFKVCCSDEQDIQMVNTTSNFVPSAPSSNNHSLNAVKTNTEASGGAAVSESSQDVLSPDVDSNQSNIVQTMMNSPVWNENQRHKTQSTPSIHHYTTSPTRFALNNSNNHNNHDNSGAYSHSNINNHNFNYNINNSPSNAHQNKPTKKTNEYDKHPNEVVKNEELTYNNSGYRSTRASMLIVNTSFVLVILIYALNVLNININVKMKSVAARTERIIKMADADADDQTPTTPQPPPPPPQPPTPFLLSSTTNNHHNYNHKNNIKCKSIKNRFSSNSSSCIISREFRLKKYTSVSKEFARLSYSKRSSSSSPSSSFNDLQQR